MTEDLWTIASTICQRRGGRHDLDHRDGFVEFETESGERHCRPLINLSTEGLAFELESDRPLPEKGSTIPAVTVRVGGHCIRGTFNVRHCVPSFSRGTVCGGEFTPATPFDRRRIEMLLHAIAEELHVLRARHAHLTRSA